MARNYQMKKMLCLLSLGVAMNYSGLAHGETANTAPTRDTVATEALTDAQGPVGQRITHVELEGVHNISPRSIMEMVGSKPGDMWSPEQSNKDIQGILSTGYFQAARMKYDEAPEGTRIIYEMVENPTFKGLRLSGNTLYGTEELQDMATVTPGVIINANRLAGDLQAIEEHYRKNGYILARIADVNMNADGTVTARVVEGVVEEIAIKGNQKTKDRAIRREIRVKVGEPLRSEDARHSIRRLNNLGIFEDVKMNLTPGREPSQYVYEIDVKELPSRSIGLGGGYNEDDGFSVSLEFMDKNFRGTTDQLKVRYEFGGNGDTKNKFRHGFEVGYVHPWLTSKEMSLSVNAHNMLRRKIDRSSSGNTISEYDRETTGFDITLTQPYGEYKRAFLGLGVKKTKHVSNEGGPHDYTAIPGHSDYISNNFGTYNSVSTGFIYDNRDNYLVPTRGKRFMLSLNQGVKIGGGDFDHTQVNLDTRKYWPIMVGKSEHVVAFRLLGGMQVGGNSPETELLSVGGDTVLRGFESGQFRGRKMAAATLEYRVPVHQYLSLVAFGEAGDAWDAGSNAIFSDPGRSFKLRTSYGFGVRLNTPLGPLRLDYGIGNGEDKGRFSFGFGASF